MANHSAIEWCDTTWNPVTGCTPTSDGCSHCYAHRMSKRLAGRCGYPADDPFKVTLHPDKLEEPLRWKKSRRVFVCSMGDIFHEQIPTEYLEKIWSVMLEAERHTFLLLTKRPRRMAKLVGSSPELSIAKNIWLGVTAENQAAADERIPLLLQTPAAVRFVSVEPMLSAVDLTDLHYEKITAIDALSGLHGFPKPHAEGPKIDLVIASCESGPDARPAKIEWMRGLRDQCIAANILFFLKQMYVDGKLVKMPELDGQVWQQIPEVTS